MESAFTHFLASPWLLAPILAVVLVAAVVQVQLGMGFGLFAAPLLALIDPHLVPAPTLVLGMVSSALVAWRERGSIRWAEVGIGMIGRLAGVAVATAILAGLAGRDAFTLFFGAMIGLAVLLSVAGWRIPFSGASLISMSTISGIMATITSVGAPPMAIIYQDRPANQARPTLSAFFAIGCLLSLGALFSAGWAGPGDLALAAAMTPAMLAGMVVAGRLGNRFDRRYRAALLAVSAAAAVILVARGLA